MIEWDVTGLLALMWETWNQVFRQILGPAERGYVGELQGHRSYRRSNQTLDQKLYSDRAVLGANPRRSLLYTHREVAVTGLNR